MHTKNIYFSISCLMILIFTAINTKAQNTNLAAKSSVNTKIEIIQFHSEHRCMTCNNIESLTKETLKSFSAISFALVNVDDSKNKRISEQFEAAGTALFLYNPKTGKKKDLTDFAFMNAGNRGKFIEGLKREINQFGN